MIRDVAHTRQVGLIDLFGPTREWFSSNREKFTVNGAHLSDAGYAKLAPLLLEGLYSQGSIVSAADPAVLRSAVLDKDWFWLNDYRMLNGVHAYGRLASVWKRQLPGGD